MTYYALIDHNNDIYAIDINPMSYQDYICREATPEEVAEFKAKKERERINGLQITKRVFMLGLQQLGITYSELKQLIAQNEQAQMEWELCVELLRGNPLLDIMCGQLDITPAQIDYIFQKANGEDV